MRNTLLPVKSTTAAQRPSFEEPWDIPLARRLHLLEADTLRVGYFYEVPESGSFRYRAYNMAQALNHHSKKYSASFFFLSDLPLIEDFTDYLDILVLVRFRYSGTVGRLIDQFRAKGKPIAFDIDDLIFSPHHTPMVAATLNFGVNPGLVLDNWFALTSRLSHTLSLCDSALTTTPTLAQEVRNTAGLSACVIPNFLNAEQVSASEEASAGKASLAHKGFTVGYFSGSTSHARDFAVAAPALSQFLSHHPEARLVIAGILDVPQELQSKKDQIDRLPFMDYLSLQQAVAQVDLNIVPLQSNIFTDSKSELKYFESAAVNTPTLATPTEVYQRVIQNGVNGWLSSDDGWLGSLEKIASLNRQKRESVAARANKSVMATYTGAQQVTAIEQALEGIKP